MPMPGISFVCGEFLQTHLESLLMLSRCASGVRSRSSIVGDGHDIAKHNELGSE